GGGGAGAEAGRRKEGKIGGWGPPEDQEAKPDDGASTKAGRNDPGERPRRRSASLTATASVATPNAVPRTRDVSSGGRPRRIKPPSSTVHRKFVYPSTRSPRLNTSCPCSARLRE